MLPSGPVVMSRGVFPTSRKLVMRSTFVRMLPTRFSPSRPLANQTFPVRAPRHQLGGEADEIGEEDAVGR